MGRLTENVVLNVKNKSHAVTADLTVPDGGATGVIVAQGGAFGGWSLYLHEGRPTYCYNLFGIQRFHVRADQAVPAGDHQVRLEFTYDGGGLGKGATADLYVDGTQVATGRVDATVPMVFSGDETLDVGSDTGTPVSDDYNSRGQRLHRPHPPRPDRPRRRRRGQRPPDHPRGTDADRSPPASEVRLHRKPLERQQDLNRGGASVWGDRSGGDLRRRTRLSRSTQPGNRQSSRFPLGGTEQQRQRHDVSDVGDPARKRRSA